MHLGKADGVWVKVSASPDLTVRAVLEEAHNRKGLDIVGLVDLHSPPARRDVEALLRDGLLREAVGGGLIYRPVGREGDGDVLLLAGVEVDAGRSHHLVFLPTLEAMATFSGRLARHLTNPILSTQRASLSAADLFELAGEHGAIFVPAHIFTPHCGVLGAVAASLAEVFPNARAISAVELGLSADAAMAARLSELDAHTFLANSDAHSTAAIAREYNVLRVAGLSFAEVKSALAGAGGRSVMANYGLDPRLGKYHRTACRECGRVARAPAPVLACDACGGTKVVVGVLDRVESIADRPASANLPGTGWACAPSSRPRAAPYIHQVPLRQVPGLGPRAMEKLLAAFGTEMAVLHRAPPDEIAAAAGSKLAAIIVAARQGRAAIEAGGGGRYGRIGPVPQA